jgi:hypothetical protein
MRPPLPIHRGDQDGLTQYAWKGSPAQEIA